MIRNPEIVRKNMQAIRSSGSKIEVLLGKSMWKINLRYRKNNKTVFGKPDFTFKKYKIAVFVDSEFWHGYNWATNKAKLKTNKNFWINKIEGNIARDSSVNLELSKSGWTVIRFWGKQIEEDSVACANIVAQEINKAKLKQNEKRNSKKQDY